MAEPKLRFKDGNGMNFPDWKTSRMESLGSFDKGRILSKADISETGIPMILYGELYTHYNEVAYEIQRKTERDKEGLFISKGGEVILPCSGENPEDISTATCVMIPNVALGGDLIIFSPHEIDGRIMSYILNHPQKYKIASVAQGKSVVHISASSIKKLDITYPVSNEEQQKIADFLSSIDELIFNLTEEIQLWNEKKKGIIQKLFSQEVKFKDEQGAYYPEWKETSLSTLLIEYHEKCPKNGTYEHVSLTKEGVVPKTERYERDFLVRDDSKNYRVTHINDICYNPANLKFGVICRNKYKDAIFSPIYVTFKTTSKVLPAFIEILVTRNDFINYALRYQEGTVYERMAVSPEDFLSIEVHIPCLEEQQKIADCLSSLDDVIRIKKQKLETWKTIKKGLLQQMFV